MCLPPDLKNKKRGGTHMAIMFRRGIHIVKFRYGCLSLDRHYIIWETDGIVTGPTPDYNEPWGYRDKLCWASFALVEYNNSGKYQLIVDPNATQSRKDRWALRRKLHRAGIWGVILW